jgi:predicted MPP superfamily phosphohydrolase
MTNLVIGDIQNKSDEVEKIINEYDCPTILLWDYFDDFHDTVDDIQRTAEWLKESLSKPNRIHLVGNHDFHYMVKPGTVY